MLVDLILIGMHTGARIEEICSLLCKDINLEEESITIEDGKTDAGNRVIPIHPYIKDLVKALIESSTDDYLLSKLTKNKYGDRSNAIGKRFGRLKTKQNFWSCPYKTGHSAFATSRINSLGDFSLNPLWG